jgi:hypothetical protein
MRDPALQTDEWFELYNNGTCTVELNDWTIVSPGGPTRHTITLQGNKKLKIDAGAYIVLGRSNPIDSVAVDYVYGEDIRFTNGLTYDFLEILAPDGSSVDKYDWDSTTPAADRTSLSRDLVNDEWCLSPNKYAENPDYFGTPGGENPICPSTTPAPPTTTGSTTTTIAGGTTTTVAPPVGGWPIVINEIRTRNDKGDGPDDITDQFIELHNYGSSPVDMGFFVIRDNDRCNSNGDCNEDILPPGLVIPGGGYLVLSDNPTYTPLFDWTGMFIGARFGDFTLLDPMGNEVDAVSYDLTNGWPNPGNSGSLSLKDPLLDNNVAGNWCAATTPTPGTVNACP